MGGCLSQQQPMPNPDRVDMTHFEEYQTIGRGGFGTVVAVAKRDPVTGKCPPQSPENPLYALKRMAKAKVAQSQVNVDMVWREREIMIINTETLRSPFLCSLHWAFQSPAELFLIMEFMQGGDLKYQMRDKKNTSKVKPLGEDVAKFYCAEILLALRALHSVSIVYRDLKPENALLDSEGHLRLADFGIATNLQRNNGFKTSGRSGTYSYMSPEMLLRDEYGTEVDLWALGVTLYELLHADLPFPSLSQSASEEQIKAHFSVPLSFHSSLSKEVKHLLTRLLHPDPARRLTLCSQAIEHPFFASINWPLLKRKEVKPPITPEQGVANCTAAAALEVAFMDEPLRPVSAELQELFSEYEYVRPNLTRLQRRGTVRDATTAGVPSDIMRTNRENVEQEWEVMQQEHDKHEKQQQEVAAAAAAAAAASELDQEPTGQGQQQQQQQQQQRRGSASAGASARGSERRNSASTSKGAGGHATPLDGVSTPSEQRNSPRLRARASASASANGGVGGSSSSRNPSRSPSLSPVPDNNVSGGYNALSATTKSSPSPSPSPRLNPQNNNSNNNNNYNASTSTSTSVNSNGRGIVALNLDGNNNNSNNNNNNQSRASSRAHSRQPSLGGNGNNINNINSNSSSGNATSNSASPSNAMVGIEIDSVVIGPIGSNGGGTKTKEGSGSGRKKGGKK